MTGVALALVALAAPGSADGAILHDQLDLPTLSGIDSTDYGAGNDKTEAADDFTVPSGRRWTVSSVRVHQEGAPAPSFNVRFYADDPASETEGLPYPGVALALRSHLIPGNEGMVVLGLGTPVVLGAGHYWVSVQANTDGASWRWLNRSESIGTPGVWRGGAGGCASGAPWKHYMSDCTMTGAGGPDLLFRLEGLNESSLTTTITRSRIQASRGRAEFRFSGSPDSSGFVCSLDRARFKPCSSPVSYAKLKRGKHRFRVAATDDFGNRDTTPATKTFKIG